MAVEMIGQTVSFDHELFGGCYRQLPDEHFWNEGSPCLMIRGAEDDAGWNHKVSVSSVSKNSDLRSVRSLSDLIEFAETRMKDWISLEIYNTNGRAASSYLPLIVENNMYFPKNYPKTEFDDKGYLVDFLVSSRRANKLASSFEVVPAGSGMWRIVSESWYPFRMDGPTKIEYNQNTGVYDCSYKLFGQQVPEWYFKAFHDFWADIPEAPLGWVRIAFEQSFEFTNDENDSMIYSHDLNEWFKVDERFDNV